MVSKPRALTALTRRRLLAVAAGALTSLPGTAISQCQPGGWADPNGIGAGDAKVLGGDDDAAGAVRRATQADDSYGWTDWTGFEHPCDPNGHYPFSAAAALPDGGKGFLSFRKAEVQFGPVECFIPARSTFFTIEYKDNLLSGVSDPYWPKAGGPQVKIGGAVAGRIEALFDHRWKRAVFRVPPAAKPQDGVLRVSIGNGAYSANELYGEMLVHRIVASQAAISPRDGITGFWPPNVDVYTTAAIYDRAKRPYVPVMSCAGLANADRPDQLNIPTIIGTNFNFSIAARDGAGARTLGSNTIAYPDPKFGPQQQRGVREQMAYHRSQKILSTPWLVSTTGEFIPSITSGSWGKPPYASLFDGTWPGMVRAWRQALIDYVASSDAPFIYLKDEWDHPSRAWGATMEMVRELRFVANEICPGVPTVVTTMGYKPLMMKAAAQLADILMVDRYPQPADIQEVGAFIEQARAQSGGKAVMCALPVLNADAGGASPPRPSNTDSAACASFIARCNQLAYFRSGFYIALVHGARGFWYFGDDVGMNMPGGRDYYASLKPLSDELSALADIIHASAVELGRTIAATSYNTHSDHRNFYPLSHRTEGDGVTSADGIAATYRQATTGTTTGRKVLVAVNETATRKTAVRFTVRQLRRGQPIGVLFEDRTLTADDGSFKDDFDGFGRHVYLVPR